MQEIGIFDTLVVLQSQCWWLRSRAGGVIRGTHESNPSIHVIALLDGAIVVLMVGIVLAVMIVVVVVVVGRADGPIIGG